MPKVARGRGRDTVQTRHGCASTTTTRDASNNVLVNNIGVHRHNDKNTTHAVPCGPSCCSHSRPIQTASSNVFANNRGVARVGDSYSGCGVVLTGSNNVYANGG